MKAKYFFFLAAAASLTLVACSKDNGQAADDQELRLSTANIISETRATSQDLQSNQFLSDEKVDIFLAENVSGAPNSTADNVTKYTQPLIYTANGTGGLSITDNPQYWPTSGNGLYIYGVYPSGAAGESASYSSTNISFSVKPDQSSDTNYKASDLMTGKPERNPVNRTISQVPLTFTHLLSKVDINLEAGDGFETEDLSNAKVYIQNTNSTTTFNVQNTTLGTTSGATSDITVCTGTTGSAIIVPQTLAASTPFIKVTVGGGEYFYKLGGETTFAQSKVYAYSITVNRTGLSVASNIGAWTDGGATSGAATLEEQADWFYVEAAQDGATVSMTGTSTEPVNLLYSTNRSTWHTFEVGSTSVTLSAAGDKVWFKAGSGGNKQLSTGYSYCSTFSFGGKVNVGGDITTLLSASGNVSDLSSYGTTYTFCKLFYNCANLVSAADLSLPSSTLSAYCYNSMFSGCTSLSAAPKLPATNLATACYSSMFYKCAKLTDVPELKAKKMAQSCYSSMFSSCEGLTSVPDNFLPATTLAASCYNNMFNYCTNLTYVPNNLLPVEELADGCYQGMFLSCQKLKAAPALPSKTLAKACYASMFSGCTSLTVAPTELPATELKQSCYGQMFNGCSNLRTAPSIGATALAETCCLWMFKGTALTESPVLKAETLVERCYNGMFENCSNLAKVTLYATSRTNASGEEVYAPLGNWLPKRTSGGVIYKRSEFTLNSSEIPNGWTTATITE